MIIQTGDVLPCDGVITQSSQLAIDESSLTGEIDLMKKTWDDAKKASPFVLSGSQVAQGTGEMVVTCVGKNSFEGKNRELIQGDEEEGETALQEKLNRIAAGIGKVGFVMALLTFFVLMVYMVIDIISRGGWFAEHTQYIIKSFITAVTILVVAVPEGLPLAVTLSLAYSVNKMKDENNLVRHLAACEIMGGATNICSDKTGTLTENVMTVVQMWAHGESKEVRHANRSTYHDDFIDLLVDGIC